jgi:GNAT superfamily N-acetyltransferase
MKESNRMPSQLIMNLLLRPLQADDIAEVVAAFAALGWGGKDAEQFERYLTEEQDGTRVTRFAFVGGVFAGYMNVVWQSSYPPFAVVHIPEINDFNVLPTFRRQGIGTALMQEAERIIATRSQIAGIGVGMHEGYGNAQRLYVRRGYVPDGRGLTTHERPVVYGESVVVDDDLVLYFTKRL